MALARIWKRIQAISKKVKGYCKKVVEYGARPSKDATVHWLCCSRVFAGREGAEQAMRIVHGIGAYNTQKLLGKLGIKRNNENIRNLKAVVDWLGENYFCSLVNNAGASHASTLFKEILNNPQLGEIIRKSQLEHTTSILRALGGQDAVHFIKKWGCEDTYNMLSSLSGGKPNWTGIARLKKYKKNITPRLTRGENPNSIARSILESERWR